MNTNPQVYLELTATQIRALEHEIRHLAGHDIVSIRVKKDRIDFRCADSYARRTRKKP